MNINLPTCPHCNVSSPGTTTSSGKLKDDPSALMRRHKCKSCFGCWSTIEQDGYVRTVMGRKGVTK